MAPTVLLMSPPIHLFMHLSSWQLFMVPTLLAPCEMRGTQPCPPEPVKVCRWTQAPGRHGSALSLHPPGTRGDKCWVKPLPYPAVVPHPWLSPVCNFPRKLLAACAVCGRKEGRTIVSTCVLTSLELPYTYEAHSSSQQPQKGGTHVIRAPFHRWGKRGTKNLTGSDVGKKMQS